MDYFIVNDKFILGFLSLKYLYIKIFFYNVIVKPNLLKYFIKNKVDFIIFIVVQTID